MSIRIAFAGFRHYHIDELYEFAVKHPGIEVVAAAEDNAEEATAAEKRGISITDASIDALFARSADFDAVAVGDYFGRRGSLAIRALEAGKHVIVDKPLCTSLDELSEIDRVRRERSLVVGCMLNNRDAGQFISLKKIIGAGTIGEVETIAFGGQHPLNFGERPNWYFEEGKHGGTINDIAIHAIDIIPWMCGHEWSRVVAARTWNNRLPAHPHFQVCAQMMLELENQAGVLGDVSYLSPDSQGYTVPTYWRYTIHGTEGILETGMKVDEVRLWQNGREGVEIIVPEPDRTDGVYLDFQNEVEGKSELCDLTADQIIASSRLTLQIQSAADRKQYPQELS